MAVERGAKEAGILPQLAWKMARLAQPISNATLKSYADLLRTLTSALVQGRYHSMLEAERVEQLRQAQKLESIGILAGGVAHDFNNLLTGVLGNASLIMSDLPPGHAAHARAQDICAAAERAAGLTRQLLAYAGHGTFFVRPLNLSAVIRETASLLRLSISKNVALDLDLAEALPAIEADASQMQQVIMNLVINAAEAIGSDRPGVVTIRTATRQVESWAYSTPWTRWPNLARHAAVTQPTLSILRGP
jgi:nitrogen-specific signal transduction histidine kinase